MERALILDESGVIGPDDAAGEDPLRHEPAREPGHRFADADARGAGEGVHPQGAELTRAGRRSGPANILGINASTLYRKLIAYGVEKPGARFDESEGEADEPTSRVA